MTVATGRTGRRKSQETDMPAEPEKASKSGETEEQRSTATMLLALLASACLVMAIGCFYLWHQTTQDRAVESARDDARAAAQSEAKDLLSYNFRTLDYDLSKAKSEMTPGMAKSFGDYWQIFRPSVEKSQTQALTQIQVTGVTDATPTRVEVVLFVKMISVNAAHKEPQVDTSWPRLSMQKVGKKWLIDGPRMTTPPPASSTPSTPAPSKPAKKTPSGKPSHSSSGR
jgi:Mce-associated membrane protein